MFLVNQSGKNTDEVLFDDFSWVKQAFQIHFCVFLSLRNFFTYDPNAATRGVRLECCNNFAVRLESRVIRIGPIESSEK